MFKRVGYVDTKELFTYLRSTYQSAKDSQDRFVVVDDNNDVAIELRLEQEAEVEDDGAPTILMHYIEWQGS